MADRRQAACHGRLRGTLQASTRAIHTRSTQYGGATAKGAYRALRLGLTASARSKRSLCCSRAGRGTPPAGCWKRRSSSANSLNEMSASNMALVWSTMPWKGSSQCGQRRRMPSLHMVSTTLTGTAERGGASGAPEMMSRRAWRATSMPYLHDATPSVLTLSLCLFGVLLMARLYGRM